MAGSDKEHHKVPQNARNASISSRIQDSNEPLTDQRGIALAAKDSEWIGMRTDFMAHDRSLSLFPGIKFSDSTESTTVITKLLVGKTADFSTMQKPERVFISRHLSTVRESPENFNTSKSDISSVTQPGEMRESGSDLEIYDEDDDEPKRATHTKRRKRRSDVKELPGETSSISIIETARRKTTSKLRRDIEESSKSKPMPYSSSWGQSNDADDEYQTQSEETITHHRSKRNNER